VRLDEYELKSLVGRGGMGDVYRAYDFTLQRDVAIKVLQPGSNPERFLHEARIAARISSPHAVAVFNYRLLADGRAIIVMEFVEGRTVSDLIRDKGVLPVEDLVRYMDHAATGMTAAAEIGVVHRDLKPANMLVDRTGRLRVADFGIARLDRSEVETRASALTADGPALFGTPTYMAPEQAENPRGADVRSDVYSYGASFYHAATGVPPFDGPGALAVVLKHKLETPVSPQARRQDLPRRLNDVIERCLAKSPADRFQTFDEVRVALVDSDVSAWNETFDPVAQRFMQDYLNRRAEFWDAGSSEVVTYHFPNGRTLHITRGNLADATADAIVSSADEMLTMGGGVAAALNSRSGFHLAAETRKYGRRVRHGGVVVTSAGKLNAKFVLHAITIGTNYEPRFDVRTALLPSRDVLREIMKGCFYHADTLGLGSLAFPLLGTGAARFPPDVCLDTMMSFLIGALLYGAHTVQRVQIVLYSPQASPHS
jgi:O-acetyl-ADP-ribose deacetylase (regulator of RNase III)